MTYYAYSKSFDCELELAGIDDHGNPIYEDAFPVFAEILQHNIQNHRQNVVVVCGGTGSGKSMAMLSLIKKIDRNWQLEKNMVYSPGDLRSKLDNLDKANPLTMMDEGSVILNKKNAMTKNNKVVNLLFDTMRSLGWTTFIGIPQFRDLDRNIRDFHSNYMMMCPAHSPVKGYDPRGFITIYQHEVRDWGRAYYHPLLTTKFDLPSRKTIAKYEEIKRQRQVELLKNTLEVLE